METTPSKTVSQMSTIGISSFGNILTVNGKSANAVNSVGGSVTDGNLKITVNGVESGDIPLPKSQDDPIINDTSTANYTLEGNISGVTVNKELEYLLTPSQAQSIEVYNNIIYKRANCDGVLYNNLSSQPSYMTVKSSSTATSKRGIIGTAVYSNVISPSVYSKLPNGKYSCKGRIGLYINSLLIQQVEIIDETLNYIINVNENTITIENMVFTESNNRAWNFNYDATSPNKFTLFIYPDTLTHIS